MAVRTGSGRSITSRDATFESCASDRLFRSSICCLVDESVRAEMAEVGDSDRAATSAGALRVARLEDRLLGVLVLSIIRRR